MKALDIERASMYQVLTYLQTNYVDSYIQTVFSYLKEDANTD